jgi:hypothetical protein
MEENTERRRRRRSRSEKTEAPDEQEEESLLVATLPAWAVWALGLFPVLVCLLGSLDDGRTQAGVAAVVGLLALCVPPRTKLPLGVLCIGMVVVCLPLLTMVELPWPKWPAWRLPLINDLGVVLPSTWSAQRWVTLEVWSGTVVTVVWLLWCALGLTSPDDRRRVVQVLTAGLVGIALLSLAARFVDYAPAMWGHAALQNLDFGPFANRSHLSTLMAMTTVLCLACAYDLQRRRERVWLLYGLGVVPVFTCILINTSRAGVALFFVGVVAWFATAALRKGTAKRLAVAGTVLLVATSGLVLFGSHLVEKFKSVNGSVVQTIVGDGRSIIFKDTLKLVSDHAGLGIGLGNFAAIFGMTNSQKDPLAVMLHPESDWLWYLAEAGWPATLAMLIGLVFLLTLTGPWAGGAESSNRRSRRLRIAAAIAAMLAIMHGFVDTPIHNRAFVLVLCLVAALALSPKKLEAARGWSLPWLFRLAGLGCLVASAMWGLSVAGKHSYFGVSDLNEAMTRAAVNVEKGAVSAALSDADHAVKMAPLASPAYTLRAQTTLAAGGSETAALMDFARARFIEPNLAIVCHEEIQTWMQVRPTFAMAALRELLVRDPIRASTHYALMLNEVLAHHEELKPAMLDLATSPHYLLYYLERMRGAEFKATLAIFLERYPTLEGLSKQEGADLFHTWQAVGDRDELFRQLSKHTEWHAIGWPVLAQELAARGDAGGAYKLARKEIQPLVNVHADILTPVSQLELEFRNSPTDVLKGLTLAVSLRARAKKGEAGQSAVASAQNEGFKRALETLEKIVELPGAKATALLEMSSIKAEMGEAAAAWELLQRYMVETKML